MDKMGTGYETLWNAFKRITAGYSPTEKLALHGVRRGGFIVSTEAGKIADRSFSGIQISPRCRITSSRRCPATVPITAAMNAPISIENAVKKAT
jgi:hypothetical protein